MTTRSLTGAIAFVEFIEVQHQNGPGIVALTLRMVLERIVRHAGACFFVQSIICPIPYSPTKEIYRSTMAEQWGFFKGS